MPRTTATHPATSVVRHNERIQVMVTVKGDAATFDHLKVFGVEHLATQDGVIVKPGSDLVQICDVNHQDLPTDILVALNTIYHWADGLDHKEPTPEQRDRAQREKEAAEAAAEEKRLKEVRDAKAKADTEAST